MSEETVLKLDEITPSSVLVKEAGGDKSQRKNAAALVLVMSEDTGEGGIEDKICHSSELTNNKPLECLVCWEHLENNNVDQEKDSAENSDSSTTTLTLLEFCKLLKVNIPPRTKASLKRYNTPICPVCHVGIAKLRCVLVQIEELEKSLLATRTLIKEKIVVKFRENFNGETMDTHTFTELLNAVTHIRNSITKDLSEAAAKALSVSQSQVNKPESKKTSKQKVTGKKTESNAEDEIESHRSSFGRVVKRPKFFMMEEVEEDSVDEEQKFDISQDSSNKISLDPISISIIKSELPTYEETAGPSTGSTTTSNFIASDILKGEAANEDVEMSNDSDVEFQINSPDANWSDGEISEEETKKPAKKIVKRKKKVNKKTKVLPKKLQVTLVGTDGKELGSSEIKDGKVVIDTEFHKKLMDGEAVIKVDKEILGLRVKCGMCYHTFTNAQKRERHVRRFHLGKKDYECKTCKEQFFKLKDLAQHRKEQHRPIEPKIGDDGRKTFECEFCPNAFKNFSDLRIHRRRHTGERPFKCDICAEGFISKGRREVHIEVVHPDCPPLRCEFCPRRFFRHHRLRDHKKSHTGERPYLCEICSKSFSQPAYLKYHQTKHKELNMAEYKCDKCDKKFATPVNLKFHNETQHNKNYRYHCDVCGHGATHKSHMKLHMRSHTGEKPHVCPYCGKSFSRGSQLKIHIRGHTGERPYVCKTCQKTFTNSSKLRRHELTHTSVKKRRNEVVKVVPATIESQDATTDIKILPEAIHVEENVTNHAVLKLEQLPAGVEVEDGSEVETEIQQQLITIEQANGVTYQVIATNDVLNEPYTEYIVLNGDFTLA